ncbi:DHA2 family efflux MFS transporter permease subunit [Metabacillus halosaccharovorans]|uniref:DHA2 family efflux MFS transporter permease subunit n=1 Tax=Metabacillus halosaccharovorans TaxID=930124 RepID=UPI001C201460|nr:DHA2 family efflux MFS transporter permease subunit [Metabacillus halosaccharovorans]MBU7595774.1 DHA2 family efflux MFS transporter permease subunit [Metabacillus halosaccharovorans]
MESQQVEDQTSKIKKIPLMIVLISGAFAAVLNQTILSTALPHVMKDLQLDANVAQWLQSIFMLVNGIMIPITAFLIERFTTRGLFLTAMGLLGVGTFICSISPNFAFLMTGRVLQASGAGIMMPLMQTILFLVFPVEKRGTAMGLFGLVISFAPAIGPTLSGWLVDHFVWRSLFYILLPIIFIDMVVAYFILKNVTKQKFSKVDMLSILLSTLGFGGLLYAVSTAGGSGWSSTQVVVSMVVGVICLALFIFRQLKIENPILQFSVFSYKVFTITTIIGMVVFMGLIGGSVILPILMQDMLGYSAFESGLMLLPGALLMGGMGLVAGKLFDKFGARWLCIIGLSIMVITTFMLSYLTENTTFVYLLVVNTIRMLGLSMVLMPVTTAGLNQLPRHLIPHGTAMSNTLRQVAGGVGTALLVSVMANFSMPSEGVDGLIHGVNVSFIVAGLITTIGFVLSFLVKNKQPELEAHQVIKKAN